MICGSYGEAGEKGQSNTAPHDSWQPNSTGMAKAQSVWKDASDSVLMRIHGTSCFLVCLRCLNSLSPQRLFGSLAALHPSAVLPNFEEFRIESLRGYGS